MNKILYWSPFTSKVATVKSVINSVEAVNKYLNDKYKAIILDAVHEWQDYSLELNRRNIEVIHLNKNSMFNSDADARKVMNSITQQMIGGVQTGQSGPGLFDQLAMTTNAGNANNKQTARSVQSMEEFKALRTMYKEAVSDGRMDYDERSQLLSAHSQLLEQKGFTDESKELMEEIKSLIKQQKSLTNAIKNESTAD